MNLALWCRYDLPVDADLACVRALQARDAAQRRGLAAARRPEQRHELAPGHREVYLPHRQLRPESLAQLNDLDEAAVLRTHGCTANE